MVCQLTDAPFLRCAVGTVGVRMSLLMAVFAVVVTPWAVRVPVSSENSEANQVGSKPQATNNQNELGISDLGRVDKPRERFEDDGYTQSDEEDGIEEGTKNLGTEPLGRAMSAGVLCEFATDLWISEDNLPHKKTCLWSPSSPPRLPTSRQAAR